LILAPSMTFVAYKQFGDNMNSARRD